jgi:anti-sigma B factor antagonist
MEITTKAVNHVLLLAVKGRVDSVEAVRFEEALEGANRRGSYRLVIDMSQLEYMSSAGFRALAAAQRHSKHQKRGELVLTQVPEGVREALDLVGFTEYFKIIDPPASAVEYVENLSEDVSAASFGA